MSALRIETALWALFAESAKVFWHDIEPEFASVVDNLRLVGVRLVHLDGIPSLRIKLDIEKAPDQRWLIYSTQPEPEPTKDSILTPLETRKMCRAEGVPQEANNESR